MSSKPDSRPAAARIEVLGSPPPGEAAAVVAAIEQFIAETEPAPASGVRVNPWQRAALLEGVSAKAAFASPWGEPRTWGERHSHKP